MEPHAFKQIVAQHFTVQDPNESQERHNVSTNPRFIPLQIRSCTDCGQSVVDQRIYLIRRALDSPAPYWIKKCSVCSQKTRISKPFDI